MKKVSFSKSQFKQSADFSDCRFADTEDSVSFDRVTDFSDMMIEWDRPLYGEDKTRAGSSGLEGNIKYERAFFIALKKNYRELGYQKEANEVEFTYRQRENRSKDMGLERILEYALLELMAGYGIKIERLFYSFGVISLIFMLIYLTWGSILFNVHPFDKGKKSRTFWWLCAWAFTHSFNNQTLFIKLNRIERIFENKLPKTFVEKKKNALLLWPYQLQTS